VSELKPIDWEQVGAEVIRSNYERLVRDFGRKFPGATVGDVPEALADVGGTASRLRGGDEEVHPDVARDLAIATPAAATVLALLGAGWRLEALPGEAAVCRRGDEERVPYADVHALVAGELDAATWRSRYAEVADAPIMGAAAARTPEPA
jgi:hypothetical protein